MLGDTGREILKLLRSEGALQAREIADRLGLAPTSIREQLDRLLQRGWLVSANQRQKVGRPRKLFSLTAQGDALFPRRYDELLDLLARQIKAEEGSGRLLRYLEAIAAQWATMLAPMLDGLEPEDALIKLAEHLDLGGMMAELQTCRVGYELNIHNCVYSRTAECHEEVCRMIPTLIERVTGCPTHATRRVYHEGGYCTYAIAPPDRKG